MEVCEIFVNGTLNDLMIPWSKVHPGCFFGDYFVHLLSEFRLDEAMSFYPLHVGAGLVTDRVG